MFGLIEADSETFWLTVTNIALGLVVLVCLAGVISGAVLEVLRARRERRRLSEEIDRDLKQLVAEFEAESRIHTEPDSGPARGDRRR